MKKVGVSLKIDVTKIDKARLFSGAKGKYLDATVFIDTEELDQYGNSGMITQDVSKEEKDQGVKGNILGNCKVFWKDQAQQQAPNPYQQPQQQPQQPPQYGQQPAAPQPPQAPAPNNLEDDLPF